MDSDDLDARSYPAVVFENELVDFGKIYLGGFESNYDDVGALDTILYPHQVNVFLDFGGAAEILFEHLSTELNPLLSGGTGNVDIDWI